MKKLDKPFYIGWQASMPGAQTKFLRKILIPLFVLIPLLMFALAYFLLPSANHQFEFGKAKEYYGIYYENPLPMLIVESTDWPRKYQNPQYLSAMENSEPKESYLKLNRKMEN